jgi:hypothetical protein
MVRLSEVSPEAVFNACYALLAEGKNPSFPSVYERIGRKGGSKVVQGYISEWRHSVAGKLASRTRDGVPDRIVRATDDLADAIWNEAIATVDAIVESRRQEIEAEAADMRAAAAQVEAVARSQVADLTGRLTENEKALALATQRVHGLDDVLRDRESHLAARDQTIAHQLTVMAEKDAERRLLQAEIDRREEERRDLLKKVERARKDATYLEVANSGLNSSLTEARVLVNGLRMELENVRSLHNKAHGEVEALSARLS